LLQINPHLKVIGLTATPWRMNDGLITEGEAALFSSIAYEVEIKTLLDGGYICPPICKTMDTQIDTSGVAVRGGEFVAGALEKAADKAEITKAAVAEIITLGQDRHSWLVFASGVDHAHHIRDEFEAHGITCEAIAGKTPTADRDQWIKDYQSGRIKCLVNVGVLTVGFDAPATDLLAILRPTKSSRLWLQILGRGFRLSPETAKGDFLVLDYTSNSRSFGPIDLLRPKPKRKGAGEPGEMPHKACPECEAELLISSRECLACGYVFPEAPSKINHTADTAPLLSSQIRPEFVEVVKASYRRHEKPGKPPTMRVDYLCGLTTHSEWISFEATGYPRQKACQWWYQRAPNLPVPMTVADALAQAPQLRVPHTIQVKQVGSFHEVVSARFS
jgi:DNA repair protein RadD